MNVFERRQLKSLFAQHFNKYLMTVWGIGALFFIFAWFAFGNGYKSISLVMVAGFVSCIVGFIGYSFYRVYFVRCPECLGRTKTYADKTERKWIARCHMCSIDWDIGIGVSESDGSS